MNRPAAALLRAALLLAAGSAAAGSAAAVEPAAPLTAPATAGPMLEWSGSLSAVASEGLGALDAYELPRAAARGTGERTSSLSVRQSRLGVAATLPASGRLAGAALRARVEVDFAGGTPAAGSSAAGAELPSPQPRLREAWAEARLEGPARLAVLAGQAAGLFAGPNLAASVTHLAVARFSGAGDLSRRAPQLRLSAGWGGPLELALQAALLAPLDPHLTAAPAAANPTPVGVRSGLPEAELRAALGWRGGEGCAAALGLSGHAGRQRYRLDALVGKPDREVDSWGGALDLRLDLGPLTLVGAAWAGTNLGALGTGVPGATLWTDASGGGLVAVSGVRPRGAWAQLQWRAGDLTVLAGGGQEAALRGELPTGDYQWKSGQLSAGLLLALGGGWRAGLEGTGYWTRATAGPASRSRSTQVEAGLLVEF